MKYKELTKEEQTKVVDAVAPKLMGTFLSKILIAKAKMETDALPPGAPPIDRDGVIHSMARDIDEAVNNPALDGDAVYSSILHQFATMMCDQLARKCIAISEEQLFNPANAPKN